MKFQTGNTPRGALVNFRLSAVLLALLLSSCKPGFLNSSGSNADSQIKSAVSAHQSGNFEQADELWLAVLKQAEYSHDNALLNEASYNLARLYCDWGQYEKAIPYYESYLDYKARQVQGDEYRALAWNQAELGNFYFASGAWSSAAARYEEALSDWLKYARIPETVAVFHKIALCHWLDGSSADPETAFEQALKMYDRSLYNAGLGERRHRLDAEIALTLEDYARFLDSKERAQEAGSLRERARNIWQHLSQLRPAGKEISFANAPGTKKGLPDLSTKVSILKGLAEYYCQMGRNVDAMLVYDALFDLETGVPGKAEKPDSQKRSQLVAEIYRLRDDCLKASAAKNSPANRAPEDKLANPYFAAFKSLRDEQECFDKHQQLCHRFAWAVPDAAAIAVLKRYQPIIEIGAGTGYWSYLLRNQGIKVSAYDLNPVPSTGNQWHRGAGRSWTTVLSGDETAVRRSSAQTLFLCWPPEVNRCAYNSLRLFNGNILIYVGEGRGGCSATREFFNLLDKDWDLIERIEIPQWPGVYDALFVYMRKRRPASATAQTSPRPATSARVAAMLGRDLSDTAQLSHTLIDDLSALLEQGFKVKFINGPCRAYFDQKTRTINIAKICNKSRKLLAISHEYAHAMLNPTKPPLLGKTDRHQFIEQGMQDEADAIVHELVVARELQAGGVNLDKPTADLLNAFNNSGPRAVMHFLERAKNSATDESYVSHFGQWYDEVARKSRKKR